MPRNNIRQPYVRSEPGVYLVRAAGLVKIGIVNAVWGSASQIGLRSRLQELQTASPVPLVLHRFIACEAPQVVEHHLHRIFASYRHHGEWFEECILAELDACEDSELTGLALDRLF